MIKYTFNEKTIRICEAEYLEVIKCETNSHITETDYNILFPSLSNQTAYNIKKKENNNPNYPCMDFDVQLLEGYYHIIFFDVESNKDSKVILRLGTLCYMKLWVNGNIIFNGPVHGNDSAYILYQLKKGLNRFLIGVTLYNDAYIKNKRPSFSLLISHIEDINIGINSNLFKDYIHTNICNQIGVTHMFCDANGKKTYQILLLPYDYINLSIYNIVKMKVYNNDYVVIYETDLQFAKTYSLNLFNFELNHYPLLFVFEYKVDNKIFTKRIYMNLPIQLNIHVKLENQMNNYMHEETDNALVTAIEGRINVLNTLFEESRQEKQIEDVNVDEYMRLYYETTQLVCLLKNDKLLKDNIIKSRFYSHYYKSKLDEKFELINISLPKGYNPNKKYPIILYLDLKRYSYVSKYVATTENDKFIFADISCRGYSMGSYIGEAAFKENLDILKELFSIDDNRIYLFGISAGAFSAWSLACSYPDMFAAIAVSCGVAQTQSLENVYHLPILSIGAYNEMYHIRGFVNIDKEMSGVNSNYEKILLEHADDNTINFIKYSQYIYDWLLGFTKKQSQNKVFFYTEKFCHRKSFGFEILKMDSSSKFARFEVQTSDIGTVIKTSGICSFKIVDKKNNHTIKLSNFNDIEKNNTYYRYQGIGLLQVYFNTLKVICSDPTDELLKRISIKFSQPKTFGYESRLYVEYPILNECPLRLNLSESNYIWVGYYTDLVSTQPENLLQTDKLRLNNDCIEFRNKQYVGSYSILYIIPNSYNPQYNILVCCANDKQAIKRNFYLRNIYIPSYINGQNHPYNNCMIIFLNGKYYYLPNWDCDIELLPLKDFNE